MGKKKVKQKLHEVSLEHDIRYRGPLSYRHFRILGWICIALSQVVVLLSLISKAAPRVAEQLGILPDLLSSISGLSVPFLLLANFAVILDHRDGFRRQLLINGVAAAAIILVYLLFYYRYLIGTLAVFTGGREEAISIMDRLSSERETVLVFNFFIDLLLCTLVMFFLDYRPGRIFVGKKQIIFRLFALFPIAYELASLTLQILSAIRKIRIPPQLYPFLTTKPPMTFLVFLVLVFYIKRRERHFCRYGRTHQEYRAFLKTNRNSFQFSRFTAILLVIAGVLDVLSLVIVGGLFTIYNGGDAAVISDSVDAALNVGFGKSIILILMAPVVLLFSYTRTHKNRMIDLFIPVFGVVLIVFVYLEGFHAAAGYLPSLLETLGT